MSGEKILKSMPRRWAFGLAYAQIKSSRLVNNGKSAPRIEAIVKLSRKLEGEYKTPPLRPHRVIIQNGSKSEPLFSKSNRLIVSCDCEDFMYRWEYALAKRGAAVIKMSNGEAPISTNPRLVPGCCRHVGKVLSSIMKRKV